jgi:hypothetical protein
LREDNTFRCDRCGRDLGNAGPDVACHINDTEPDDPRIPRRLQLCLDYPDPDDPDKTIQGCRDRVLTKRALANLHKTNAKRS